MQANTHRAHGMHAEAHPHPVTSYSTHMACMRGRAALRDEPCSTAGRPGIAYLQHQPHCLQAAGLQPVAPAILRHQDAGSLAPGVPEAQHVGCLGASDCFSVGWVRLRGRGTYMCAPPAIYFCPTILAHVCMSAGSPSSDLTQVQQPWLPCRRNAHCVSFSEDPAGHNAYYGSDQQNLGLVPHTCATMSPNSSMICTASLLVDSVSLKSASLTGGITCAAASTTDSSRAPAYYSVSSLRTV